MEQSWENNTNSGNNPDKKQYWEYRLVTMDILIILRINNTNNAWKNGSNNTDNTDNYWGTNNMIS